MKSSMYSHKCCNVSPPTNTPTRRFYCANDISLWNFILLVSAVSFDSSIVGLNAEIYSLPNVSLSRYIYRSTMLFAETKILCAGVIRTNLFCIFIEYINLVVWMRAHTITKTKMNSHIWDMTYGECILFVTYLNKYCVCASCEFVYNDISTWYICVRIYMASNS